MRRDESVCRRIETQLAGYAAGDLDPREIVEVERHLVTCPDCRGELATEISLRETLATLPLVPCPARVSENIMAAVEASDDGRDGDRRLVVFPAWRRAIGGLAAAAAVIALLVAAPWRDRPDGTEFAAADALTEQEIMNARRDIRQTLVLAIRIIEESERKTVSEVFGRRLPGAIDKSVKAITTSLEGGQG